MSAASLHIDGFILIILLSLQQYCTQSTTYTSRKSSYSYMASW